VRTRASETPLATPRNISNRFDPPTQKLTIPVGVTHAVRGRDLAASTAIQIQLQRLLGLTTPSYRHHFLLLEAHGERKLAKLHQSVSWRDLEADGAAVCGRLAWLTGLLAEPRPTRPAQLVAGFDWARVCQDDVAVAVDADGRLQRLETQP